MSKPKLKNFRIWGVEMKSFLVLTLVVVATCFLAANELLARGGGGGGRGGGGGGGRSGGGGGGGRSPSMSRPAARGLPRKQHAPRPSTQQPLRARQPAASPRPPSRSPAPSPLRVPDRRRGAARALRLPERRTGDGHRPAAGVASRPSAGQLNNFLDVGGPGAAGRPSTGTGNLAGAVAGRRRRRCGCGILARGRSRRRRPCPPRGSGRALATGQTLVIDRGPAIARQLRIDRALVTVVWRRRSTGSWQSACGGRPSLG